MSSPAKMTKFVCAVDVGTASVRAGIFTPGGRMLARAVHPIMVHEGPGGFAEHSSANIWQAVCEAVRGAVAESSVEADAVSAIAFDATCSLVLLDEAGNPLLLAPDGRDTICWFDHRAVDEAAAITATGHRVIDHVGGAMSPEMQTPKLLWLKRNRPDLWSRLGLALDLADFLAWRASGRVVRSACTVTAKWTWLPDEGGWQDDFLRQAGLEDLRHRAGLDCPVLAPGTAAGTLTPAAAGDLGLHPGTVVSTGLIDAYSGTLGILAGSAGESIGTSMALIAGTSSCVMCLTPGPLMAAGIWGPFHGAILPGLHVSEGGQSATGATLDHILRWFGRREEVASTLHDRVNARLQVLLAEAGGDLGRDLHVLPDFNGNRSPQADPFARAVISGLTLDTSFDALCILYWRAAVGLAAGLRQIIGHMRQGASPASRLHVTGGHVRNPLLIQLYADMTGLPLFVPQAPDAVLLGTAMLAASAGGLHPGLEAAARAMASPLEQIVPDPSRRAAFDRDYSAFLAMQGHRVELASISAVNRR